MRNTAIRSSQKEERRKTEGINLEEKEEGINEGKKMK